MKFPSAIEPLESRIAPAAMFVSTTTASYDDVDGDHVKVVFSKPILDMGNVATVVQVDANGQLLVIDLNGVAADGTSITITAKPGANGGDGLANVGFISAAGAHGKLLGAVKIPGDLGEIAAGNDMALTATGVASLSVTSLGRFGTDTGALDIMSKINGKLGSLKISGDGVSGTTLRASAIGSITVGGAFSTDTDSDGDIGMVKVGGNVFAVHAVGKIAGATVGGSVSVLSAGGSVGKVKIGGSLSTLKSKTLAGLDVGRLLISEVRINGDAGPIKIRGDSGGDIVSVNGDLAGVSVGGDFSGEEFGADRGNIGAVQIGGNLLGAALRSGGDIASVRIGGDLTGFSLDEEGKIDCGGKLGSLTIAGSLIGAAGNFNTITDANMIVHEGQVFAVGAIGKVVIGGNVEGGKGIASGEIRSHTAIGSVVIGGSLLGFASNTAGDGVASGQIASDGDLGSVKIGGELRAGAGSFSGRIGAGGKIGSVSIGGEVGPGNGSGSDNSAVIVSTGDMGSVTIGGDLRGSGNSSGLISSGGKIKSVTLGGSLLGYGFGNISGAILATGELGSVKIAGDIQGGIPGSAPLDSTGYIHGARIGSVFVGGSIFASSNSSGQLVTRSASIAADHDIGSITVLGSLVGSGSGDPSDSKFSPVVISARGKASMPATGDVAIGKITVGGNVDRANILAGYDADLAAKNADAQIGMVKVSGDWISSNLVAGVKVDADGLGNSTDLKISGGKDLADKNGAGAISKIASVIIKGNAIGHSGTAADFVTFGIEAQLLGTIKVGNATVPLLAGAGTDLMGAGNDVGNAHALGSTKGTTIHDGFSFHAFEVPLT